jgi:hypothetical protein
LVLVVLAVWVWVVLGEDEQKRGRRAHGLARSFGLVRRSFKSATYLELEEALSLKFDKMTVTASLLSRCWNSSGGDYSVF